MKRTIVLITVLILVIVATFLIFLNTSQESKASDTHIYTKAVCNETNYCQDYQVECQGKELIKMSPITGASVQYSKNWQDPRDENTINSIC